MLLVDLAFDTINHELIIVKYMHMAFLLISVDDKKSRTIQFSVLGLTLVNIYIYDIFFSTRDVRAQI